MTKIVLYMGPAAGVPSLRPRSVGPQIVLACASQDPEKTAFGFVDAVAQKNYSQRQIPGSKTSKVVHPVPYSPSRSYALTSPSCESKKPSKREFPRTASSQGLGVHPYLAKAPFSSPGRGFPQLEKAVRLLLAVDEGLKTGAMDAETGHRLPGCRHLQRIRDRGCGLSSPIGAVDEPARSTRRV